MENIGTNIEINETNETKQRTYEFDSPEVREKIIIQISNLFINSAIYQNYDERHLYIWEEFDSIKMDLFSVLESITQLQIEIIGDHHYQSQATSSKTKKPEKRERLSMTVNQTKEIIATNAKQATTPMSKNNLKFERSPNKDKDTNNDNRLEKKTKSTDVGRREKNEEKKVNGTNDKPNKNLVSRSPTTNMKVIKTLEIDTKEGRSNKKEEKSKSSHPAHKVTVEGSPKAAKKTMTNAKTKETHKPDTHKVETHKVETHKVETHKVETHKPETQKKNTNTKGKLQSKINEKNPKKELKNAEININSNKEEIENNSLKGTQVEENGTQLEENRTEVIENNVENNIESNIVKSENEVRATSTDEEQH